MCKSIYKKLLADFSFLKEYGYYYAYSVKHFIVPAIVFSKNKTKIVIGFNYAEDKFYINFWENEKQLHPKELLNNILLPDKTYKAQFEIVQSVLKDFLSKAE